MYANECHRRVVSQMKDTTTAGLTGGARLTDG